MLLPLLPCCSLDYLGWQLLNEPFLFYIFFSFHPCLPRFPHGVYNCFAVYCAFSPPFRPPRSYSRSPSRYRRPLTHLRYCPCFRPRSRPRSHPVFVYGSPPPSPSPFPPRPRPRSRPRSRPALLRSLPPPFTFPLRPRPHDRSRPRYRLRSHLRLQSRPRPRSLLPAPRTRLPPGTMRLYRRRALRMGLSGARKRHPLSAEIVTRAE